MAFSDWRKNHRVLKWYTLNLAFASMMLAMSSLSFGFDTQAFNGVQALPTFKKQFGEPKPGSPHVMWLPTWYLSLFNSIVFIGQMIGALGGSYLGAYIGRKKTVIIMSSWLIITAIILVTSKTKEQILIGRFLNYIYVGMELVTIPLYQSEISPPAIRGFTVGSYHLCLTGGGFIMSIIVKACTNLHTNWQWQIPFICYVFFPTIIIIGTFFMPESPRWLLLKGRDDDAREALQWLHGKRHGGYDAETEVQVLRAALDAQPEKGKYRELIQGTNKKVFGIVLGMFFFIQSTGQAFSSQYGATFVQQLSTIDPFNINIIAGVIGVVGTFVAIAYVDKMGRRVVLLTGSGSLAAILYIMAGCGTPANPSRNAQAVIVAMKVLFGFFYHITWGAVTNTVVTELAAAHLRDKTMRLGVVVKVLTNFVVSFSLGYAIRAIGAQIGYIFGTMAVFSAIFVFFCVPECRGRGLEEVQLMFKAGVPVRQFKHYNAAQLKDTIPATPLDEDAEKGMERGMEKLDPAALVGTEAIHGRRLATS